MILVETIEHFAADFARMSSPFDYSASSVGEAVGTVMQAGRVDVTPGTHERPDPAFPVPVGRR
jgi:hypothetical protein